MDNEELQNDLERMAGNAAIADEIKASLVRLAGGAASPELAEMADDLLNGRINLRTVAQSSAYSDQLLNAVGEFRRWHSQLTSDEQAQLVNETQARIASKSNQR